MNEQEQQWFEEGYNDGLAGIGMQDRRSPEYGFMPIDYGDGFYHGSLDRKEMLREQR